MDGEEIGEVKERSYEDIANDPTGSTELLLNPESPDNRIEISSRMEKIFGALGEMASNQVNKGETPSSEEINPKTADGEIDWAKSLEIIGSKREEAARINDWQIGAAKSLLGEYIKTGDLWQVMNKTGEEGKEFDLRLVKLLNGFHDGLKFREHDLIAQASNTLRRGKYLKPGISSDDKEMVRGMMLAVVYRYALDPTVDPDKTLFAIEELTRLTRFPEEDRGDFRVNARKASTKEHEAVQVEIDKAVPLLQGVFRQAARDGDKTEGRLTRQTGKNLKDAKGTEILNETYGRLTPIVVEEEVERAFTRRKTK